LQKHASSKNNLDFLTGVRLSWRCEWPGE